MLTAQERFRGGQELGRGHWGERGHRMASRYSYSRLKLTGREDAENNIDVPYYPHAGFAKVAFVHAFR